MASHPANALTHWSVVSGGQHRTPAVTTDHQQRRLYLLPAAAAAATSVVFSFRIY